jgi:aconitate hydratase
MFGMPMRGEIDYSVDLELDLAIVQPSVAGPKRPQDRIDLPELGDTFRSLLAAAPSEGGYGKDPTTFRVRHHVHLDDHIDVKEVAANDLKAATDSADVPVVLGETRSQSEMITNRPTSLPTEVSPEVQAIAVESVAEAFHNADSGIGHGSVLIASITSCTNTSNPSVMLGAGLLAKKAVELGLRVDPVIKTSLAPGSRVVTDYLAQAGLQPYLDELGFQIVGYGCTTCIGNSGPLHPKIEEAINAFDLVAASVLSGNRNFEARVHQNIKANFLMSPPLVVAFALAGRVDVDLSRDSLGRGSNGREVYLRDIWPSLEEVRQALAAALKPEVFRRLYADFADQNPKWNEIPSTPGDVYAWDESSDYIQEPPFFLDFAMEPAAVSEITGARPLGIFGDSVTTDHISPAGAIKATSPAGKYLIGRGVAPKDFNSYGSRRGNDRVMTRGTFANVRIKNLMVPGVEGGVTMFYSDEGQKPNLLGKVAELIHLPGSGGKTAEPSKATGEQMSIFDAAVRYAESNTPLVIFAGQEYGTGSSRDWAAKGTRLLGVRAVIAASFERIHRSNLVGMGVLPLQFLESATAQTLALDGSETFDIQGLSENCYPGQMVTLVIHRADGTTDEAQLRSRIDTAIEVDYYRHGGILPYVLRELLARP